jgi:HK97 family phage prohead protease
MAEWDTDFVNSLPDSAFACIDAGGEKDEDGKTVPRSLRHYPHHNAAGEVDLPHLANARARVAQDATTSCGREHLMEHALPSDERAEPDLTVLEPVGQLEIRNAAKRELGIFLLPWNTPVETVQGVEEFRAGAFSKVNPSEVRLRMDHQDPPTGRGLSIEERADGPYMTFRVSKTQRGDDQIALAMDGVSNGASIGFNELPGSTDIEQRNGRRIRVHRRVDLREVSTTWRPVYERAAVLSIRSQDQSEAEVAPMAETAAPESGATPEAPLPVQIDTANLEQALDSTLTKFGEKFADRLDKLEERARSSFAIPNGEPERPKASRGDWLRTVLGMLSGERVSQHDLQVRALDDLITTDNIGVVPPAYSTELIGVIDPRRPFMQTTRRLATPASGMSLVMPKIVTRPTVAKQTIEKAELDSTATSITTATYNAVSKGGAGDISLQLLKRSDPSFLALYLELLAEAYAIESESEAVESLLASGVNSGGALDPEDLSLGAAWSDTFDAIARTPDTIWLSSAAVAKFIDAKAATTNSPLYSQITANFTAGGIGGTLSGLRAVHVPALNATDIDVVVGPSTGFAWAEDGTYTLQVDVPAKAGRDVAIIGMLWFAPLYPAAFTAYSVAGGGS